MANPFDVLIPNAPDPSDAISFRWGTVQDDGLILLDTDTSPLSDNPPTLTPVSPGDRVFVLLHARRSVVLGKAVTS